MEHETQKIVLVVPTFRRLEMLTHLMPLLLDNLKETGAKLLIADNDCDLAVEKAVNVFTEQWPETYYLPVKERGLSSVRNAMVRYAREIAPEWDWLVMIDDDSYVSEGWLSKLIFCADSNKADLAGGPVLGVLPEKAGLIARNSIVASRKRFPTGIVTGLNGTSNLAISRAMFLRVPEPLFSLAYNFSGGEDYEFFRRTRKAGCKMVWCDEAVNYEPATEAALRPANIIKRYFTTGAYMALIDSKYDGFTTTLFGAAKGLVGSIIRAPLALFKNLGSAVRECLGIAHYTGRLFGLMGWRSARYKAGEKAK
jgi:succinoglycan biosynthesis protein ExoM